MQPRNTGCLTAARIDCCCLANNHVLDWGYAGLTETLETLDRAGIAHAGAGANAAEAGRPAVLEVPGKGRVLVFSLGSTTAGVPGEWRATSARPGVTLLEDLSDETARQVTQHIQQTKRPGDVAVASIHWADNWGYAISDEQVRFSHRLVERGVDLVHGHSSHHPKALEVYRDRLILYGCGDFLDDYEGISGHEAFRGELRLLYLVWIDPHAGCLRQVRLVPMRIRRFQLTRATEADASWLHDLLNRLGAPFGTWLRLDRDDNLIVHHWACGASSSPG